MGGIKHQGYTLENASWHHCGRSNTKATPWKMLPGITVYNLQPRSYDGAPIEKCIEEQDLVTFEGQSLYLCTLGSFQDISG